MAGEQSALVSAYRQIPMAVLEDVASMVGADKKAADVLARMILLRGAQGTRREKQEKTSGG